MKQQYFINIVTLFYCKSNHLLITNYSCNKRREFRPNNGRKRETFVSVRRQSNDETTNSSIFSDDPMVNTDFPVKRYTAVQYTQPAAAISPLSKSTRHLSIPDPDSRYYYTHRAHQETIAVEKDNLKHGKKRLNLLKISCTERCILSEAGDLILLISLTNIDASLIKDSKTRNQNYRRDI
jgi:hypothetical protein